MFREVEWVKLCTYIAIDAPVTNHLIQFYRKSSDFLITLMHQTHNHFQKARSIVCLENSFFYCRLFNNTSIIL